MKLSNQANVMAPLMDHCESAFTAFLQRDEVLDSHTQQEKATQVCRPQCVILDPCPGSGVLFAAGLLPARLPGLAFIRFWGH